MPLTGYLAPLDFEHELRTEIGDRAVDTFGRLVLTEHPPEPIAWAQNIWFDPVRIDIASIKDGARKLRAIQRNWALYSWDHHRRATLIAGELPKVSAKPLVFPSPPPAAPLGSWTLIEPGVILASARCSSPFPNGEVQFIEDRDAPPSRAYLKLWDVFTHLGVHPGPGETCLDLGACPGGWTWVLQSLGARVIAVDKAPLDPAVARLPGVSVRRESAFGLEPKTMNGIDWLFSDVICYPSRLLGLVRRWLEVGSARRFVCTLKFQGATDFETINEFKSIPGSQLIHLAHNKHELTWVKLA